MASVVMAHIVMAYIVMDQAQALGQGRPDNARGARDRSRARRTRVRRAADLQA